MLNCNFKKLVFFIILTVTTLTQLTVIQTTLVLHLQNDEIYYNFQNWRECGGNSFVEWLGTIPLYYSHNLLDLATMAKEDETISTKG